MVALRRRSRLKILLQKLCMHSKPRCICPIYYISGCGFIHRTFKTLRKANGMFTTLCSSKELIKLFVHVARAGSLRWWKKCGHTMFHSQDLGRDRHTDRHTQSTSINIIDIFRTLSANCNIFDWYAFHESPPWKWVQWPMTKERLMVFNQSTLSIPSTSTGESEY